MTSNDIKAVALKASLDKRYGGKAAFVYVTAMKDGKKLYMGNGFVEDKRRAFPYNYDKDGVGNQVFEAALMGMFLDVEEAI